MNILGNLLPRAAFLICFIGTTEIRAEVGSDYVGQNDSVSVKRTGCNAVAYVQVPGEMDLFIGRQFIEVDGSPIAQEGGCSNTPEVREATQAHRQGLVLDRMSWDEKSFHIIKPLLVTPFAVSGGPMRGAVIRSAYDPDIVQFRGRYWVSFECVLENRDMFGVQGTSSCLGSFDSSKAEIPSSSVYVVVSAKAVDNGRTIHAACVPHLLVFKNRLYLYWSELTVTAGQFRRIGVRGAELVSADNIHFWVNGTDGMSYSNDSRSTEVWGPDPRDEKSDTAVDLKSIWATRDNVVALVSLGGDGCVTPGGQQPGCWRMAIAEVGQPLGDHIFNKAPLLHETSLPTNAQDYTRPVRNPDGGYSLLGVFYKPPANGFSELRPTPSDWSKIIGRGELIMFPFPDKRLWPAN